MSWQEESGPEVRPNTTSSLSLSLAGLVLTFFVSVLYTVEHGRENRNKEELGADELAQLKASNGLSNGSKFCINLGELLTRGWCKVLPRSRALVVYLQRALLNAIGCSRVTLSL